MPPQRKSNRIRKPSDRNLAVARLAAAAAENSAAPSSENAAVSQSSLHPPIGQGPPSTLAPPNAPPEHPASAPPLNAGAPIDEELLALQRQHAELEKQKTRLENERLQASISSYASPMAPGQSCLPPAAPPSASSPFSMAPPQGYPGAPPYFQWGNHHMPGSDIDAIAGNTNSFKGINPSCESLFQRFRALEMKYVLQIFRGQFHPCDLGKLAANTYIRRHKVDANPTDSSGLRDLLRAFEVYCQIVIFFSHESNVGQLQAAMADYRISLLDLFPSYTFQSLKDFHESFVFARIRSGQDLPSDWSTSDGRMESQILRPKYIAQATPPSWRDPKAAITPSASRPFRSCNKFNRGE